MDYILHVAFYTLRRESYLSTLIHNDNPRVQSEKEFNLDGEGFGSYGSLISVTGRVYRGKVRRQTFRL